VNTVYQLPADTEQDLRRFAEEVSRFTHGERTPAEFRAFRVPRGVYEQREADTFMLRVRCPAGIVLPHQMRALADAARRFGSSMLHVTTRQDIQIHRVLVDDIHPALVALHTAGLSTRGGGGNTVRNITGCFDAGVCPRETFDVTPHVLALTESLLTDPLSFQLPRKYKIAVSGCARDCAGATINDLGFIAHQQGDRPGFAVYVAGGMGSSARVADLLESFVPAEEAPRVAEAIKRVFDQHGNRRNRHKARLRFLVEQIGPARFRELYQAELAKLGGPQHARSAATGFTPSVLPTPQPPLAGFDAWRRRRVVAQRQPHYFLVHIPLVLGDIAAETLARLADLVEQHGERALRSTQQQNFVLRWVHHNELTALHAGLQALGLAGAEPAVLANLVACTGASTCRLGICLSRGLAEAVNCALSQSTLDLDRLGDVRIHISGCPNSCGRHPIADIGLFGAARRVEGRLVPHYVLQLGGRVGEGYTRLAQGDHAIPARNIPQLVVDLLAEYQKSGAGSFSQFLAEADTSLIAAVVARHATVPDLTAHKEYCVDWGGTQPFSLAGRGPGECGAGVFDLIEVDLESARDALRQDRPLEAIVLAARSLLVTRGEQAQDELQTLTLFSKHFLDQRLVPQSFRPLIEAAGRAAGVPCRGGAFALAPEVPRFVAAIEDLYRNMDDSLRFKPTPEPAAPAAAPAVTVDRDVDFRGVVCPMNFVKTKITLASMASGSVLAVLLDEAGARNVPGSVAQEGHEVLGVEQQQGHWRVLIRKA
jgi:sulfite reductase (ferredoxin)